MAKEHFTSFGGTNILKVVLQRTNCRGELYFRCGVNHGCSTGVSFVWRSGTATGTVLVQPTSTNW